MIMPLLPVVTSELYYFAAEAAAGEDEKREEWVASGVAQGAALAPRLFTLCCCTRVRFSRGNDAQSRESSPKELPAGFCRDTTIAAAAFTLLE